MHRGHGAQLAAGEVDVYHGRRFDHQPPAARTQQSEVLEYVGLAVLEGGHLAPCGRAAGGVDEEDVEAAVVADQPLQAVGAMHTDVLLPEGLVVVLHQTAELRVALHIVHFGCHGGEGERVDAHAACEVGDREGLCAVGEESGLVARRLLRRGLLAVEARRIEEVVARQQRGPFLARRAAALYLLHRSGHVDRRIPRGTEQQPRGVLMFMSCDEINKLPVHAASSGARRPWGGPPCR